MKKSFAISFILLLLLCACDRSLVYEKHLDNDRITWNRFDVKTFQVDITDISSGYDFYVAFRHVTAFPLDFIDIQFNLYTPSGETRMLEKRIELKDAEGNWLGDGMGDLWDVSSLVREDFRFTQAGRCTVEISSNMSYADLPGLMQVGLIVKKSE